MSSNDALYHYVAAPIMLISLFAVIVLMAIWAQNDLGK